MKRLYRTTTIRWISAVWATWTSTTERSVSFFHQALSSWSATTSCVHTRTQTHRPHHTTPHHVTPPCAQMDAKILHLHTHIHTCTHTHIEVLTLKYSHWSTHEQRQQRQTPPSVFRTTFSGTLNFFSIICAVWIAGAARQTARQLAALLPLLRRDFFGAKTLPTCSRH